MSAGDRKVKRASWKPALRKSGFVVAGNISARFLVCWRGDVIAGAGANYDIGAGDSDGDGVEAGGALGIWAVSDDVLRVEFAADSVDRAL